MNLVFCSSTTSLVKRTLADDLDVSVLDCLSLNAETSAKFSVKSKQKKLKR